MSLNLQYWANKNRPPFHGCRAIRFVPLMIVMACSGKPTGTLGDTIAELGETISGNDIVASDTGRASEPDTEVCDGVDNDGDGEVDEGLLITYYIDGDGDGYGSEAVESCEAPEGTVEIGGDCNDGDPTINPGADESCNDTDDDCDSVVDEGLTHTYFLDSDGDGFGGITEAVSACSPPENFVDNSLDCDDTSSVISPDQFEMCNGVDDDCNGRIDDGVSVMYYPDEDGDGFGVLEDGAPSCGEPAGHSTVPGDCDDGDPDIHPFADEICNGLDDDCDGVVDDHPVSGTIPYWVDGDGDGHGAGTPSEACEIPAHHAATGDDCDDTDATRSPSSAEVCNEFDDDCDGTIDEEVKLTWYPDADGDGDGDGTGTPILACTAPDGHSATSDDCDDTRSDVFDGATEVCDDADNDCDGSIDEGVLLEFFLDADGDGWGSTTTESCVAPVGHVSVDGDCDDGRDTVYPTAPELCDGIDNDCDDEVDEDLASWFYADEDGDGWGDPATATETCDPSLEWVTVGSDCDDSTALAAPDVIELCDGIDNDCDDSIDEGVTSVLHRDSDGDGYGDSEETFDGCGESEDWVFDDTDCDDDNPTTHPDADEWCDESDNDCDGFIDEDAVDMDAFYFDGDGDGYGRTSEPVYACTAPDDYVLGPEDEWAFDCDDEDDTILPGAVEICDGGDNDCNGFIDDSAVDAPTWYRDLDGDLYGDSSSAWTDCWGAVGWLEEPGDCNDDDDEIHPGVTDDCNAVDDNCDGVIDDDGGCPCAMSYRDGHAYQFCTTGRNWPNSRDECRYEDYELVTINDASEQSWVYSTAQGFAWSDWWWIGKNDRAGEGSWVWASGISSTYTFWNGSQPDNAGSWRWPYTGEDCTHMYDGSGRWNDLPCDRSSWGSRDLYYICEASFD
jgi:hypothetical protein